MELKKMLEQCVQKLHHLWSVYDELMDEDLIDNYIHQISLMESIIDNLTAMLNITSQIQ